MASITMTDFKQAVSANSLAGLWRVLKGYRLTYSGALVAQAIAAAAKTTTFLLLAYLVDDVLLQDRIAEFIGAIALSFIGLAAVEGAFTFLSGKLAAQTAEGVTLRLRNYLYDHLQRLTFTYHDNMSTGELIQRVTSDVDAVRRFYAEQAIGLGRIVLLFTINFAALLLLNVKLALASIIVVPFVMVVSFIFFRAIERRYARFQEQDAILSTTLQENLSGVRVVKAFARQGYETNKFDGENKERYRLGLRLLFLHATYWPLTDLMTGFQMLGGYVLGAIMAINGEISLGTYLAYAGMVIWIIEPMRGLGRIIAQASSGLVSYHRVIEIVREEREPLTQGLRDLPSPLRGDISFQDVGFAYNEDAEVLHHISFDVQAGQSVALLGSTGSGKTSLVNLLPRFYEYTSGKLTLDGIDIRDIARDYLRGKIGIVEQEPFLFSRSIRENITYGVNRDVSDAEVEAAARAADVHDVILSVPEGYGTIVGERGVTLSGGQKQRVAIARTLLKNPPILILDDSTSSVDTETEANIRAALDNLMSNRTTFIIAHRIQSVMNADLILVLDKGEIVQRGTHEELVNQPGVYQRIYDLQARIETELEEEIASV
ncbi:MAG TPA: ABC transporter ATP-binding protein [Phototrophicaceae bacterium]|nr:ABC transporter ATP-binding protein [Phototrophicaceae bacterium]